MKLLLVTGGTGFLGKKLVEELDNNNFKLILLTRNKLNSIFKKNKAFKNHIILQYNKADLGKLKKFKNIYGVVHLSTCYGRKGETKKEIYSSNYVYPLNIFKIVNKKNLKFFLNTDTYFKLGLKLPKGLEYYLESKKKFLNKIKLISKKSNINLINCRIFQMYGEGDNKDKFIPTIISQLKKNEPKINFTKGNQRKDFIYVLDAARAISMIINHHCSNNLEGFHNYEIGSGKTYSIKYIARLLKLKTKSKSRLIFGALKSRENESLKEVAYNKKILNLGWKQKFEIQKGLLRTIKFFD